MLVLLEEFGTGRLLGAGVAGQAGMLKSLRGEDRAALERVRRARAKLQVRPSNDPGDPDGLDDNAKIFAAAEDGRLAGVEEDTKAGRGAPMHKGFAGVMRELRQLGGEQVSEPLRKSFAPAATAPRIGLVVTAASLAGRGVVLNC